MCYISVAGNFYAIDYSGLDACKTTPTRNSRDKAFSWVLMLLFRSKLLNFREYRLHIMMVFPSVVFVLQYGSHQILVEHPLLHQIQLHLLMFIRFLRIFPRSTGI